MLPETRCKHPCLKAGEGSSLACDDFISARRARRNGKVAELRQKANPTVDKTTVDGALIVSAESLISIALYKPCNVLYS
jgi:23S rRNA pseudouridine2605 synthase